MAASLNPSAAGAVADNPNRNSLTARYESVNRLRFPERRSVRANQINFSSQRAAGMDARKKVDMVRLQHRLASAKLLETFRLGLQTFSGTARQAYSYRPVFRLNINYSMFDTVMRSALRWPLQYIAQTRAKSWILALWPGLLLPNNVYIKFRVDEYSHAFDLEKNVYTTYSHLQGHLIPYYYGDASCGSDPAIVISEAKGRPLNELSPEEITQALAATENGYNELTEAGLIHGDPRPYNIFYHDGRVTFIDFDGALLHEEKDEVKLLNHGDFKSLERQLAGEKP